MYKKGPFILEYLEMTHNTITKALECHPRLSAFRFDMRFPIDFNLNIDLENGIIQRFVDSLKAKIKYDREKSAQRYSRVHTTEVRYVWARECSSDGNPHPHYHFLLLLNQDAYHSLGLINSDKKNMSSRIIEAWASAIGLSLDQARGLVYFPNNGIYRLNQKNGNAGISPLFERVSYMCKVNTKRYGDGRHAFGCSRS